MGRGFRRCGCERASRERDVAQACGIWSESRRNFASKGARQVPWDHETLRAAARVKTVQVDETVRKGD